MREIESEPLGPATLDWPLRPPRGLQDFLDHVPCASGVKRWRTVVRRRNLAALAQQAQHELRKIRSSRKRDLIEERLRCEAKRVGAGRAQRTGSHDGRQHGLAVMKVLDESGRGHRNVEARGPGGGLAITKGHEMIKIGRGSGRERGKISGVAVQLK